MFRLVRIAAVVGVIVYLSPLRGESGNVMPGLQNIGTSGAAALGQMLTSSWLGSGNVAALIQSRMLHEAAATVALRRTLDPTTTSSLGQHAGEHRRVAPAASAPLFPPAP